MKKTALVFPGIGYHKDKPILYYAIRLAEAKGYEPRIIEYHDMPRGIKGNAELMKKAAELAYRQTEEQLRDLDPAACSDILSIGKSIGTVISAKYLAEHGVDARQIWYTPVEATFMFVSRKTLAFIGDADNWSDVNEVKRLAGEKGIPLYSYAGCDHSLEGDSVTDNIGILRDVMRISEEFIGE